MLEGSDTGISGGSTFDVLLNGMLGSGLFDDLLQHRRFVASLNFRVILSLFICKFGLLQNSNSRLFWDTRDELLSNSFEKSYKPLSASRIPFR